MSEKMIKKEETKLPLGSISDDTFFSFLDFIKIWDSNQRPKYQKKKSFFVVFDVDEEILNRLNEVILTRINKLNVYASVNFDISVRYSDLTIENYDSLNEFYTEGSDYGVPESVNLTWECRLIEPLGSKIECQVKFMTEQRLQIDDVDDELANYRSYILISIEGDDKQWINEVFTASHCIIEKVKIGGIYKPFLLFRSSFVVNIFSVAVLVLSQAVIINWLSRFMARDRREEIVSIIQSLQTIEEKFDRYIEFIYSNNIPLLNSIMPLATGFAISFVLYALSLKLVPKLVPKSCIVIGLSKRQIHMYKATYKYIVFSLIISTFLIPFMLAAIRAIANLFN